MYSTKDWLSLKTCACSPVGVQSVSVITPTFEGSDIINTNLLTSTRSFLAFINILTTCLVSKKTIPCI